MSGTFSLEELTAAVQGWCDQHHVTPANGQAADTITERTIRYYRTLGLVDPPDGGGGGGFGEKHRLQLVAIRLLQAKGMPLRRIRELLYGLGLKELRELEQRGVAEFQSADNLWPVHGLQTEQWGVTPLEGDFLLVSRQGGPLPPTVIQQINELIRKARGGGRPGPASNN